VRFIRLIFFPVLLLGCAASTRITGSWKNPNAPQKTYNRVFIAALSGDKVTRSAIEDHLEETLRNFGVVSQKSMNELTPGFKKDSLTKEEIMRKVHETGNDGILTVSVLRKETESRYVDGNYAPMSRFGYYGTFWGYYSYWSPFAYNPGYYVRDDIYYFETNLYDAGTEALVWSAQSETYSYGDLQTFSREFARLTAEKMAQDRLIKK
jgi:hypothetical protein